MRLLPPATGPTHAIPPAPKPSSTPPATPTAAPFAKDAASAQPHLRLVDPPVPRRWWSRDVSRLFSPITAPLKAVTEGALRVFESRPVKYTMYAVGFATPVMLAAQSLTTGMSSNPLLYDLVETFHGPEPTSRFLLGAFQALSVEVAAFRSMEWLEGALGRLKERFFPKGTTQAEEAAPISEAPPAAAVIEDEAMHAMKYRGALIYAGVGIGCGLVHQVASTHVGLARIDWNIMALAGLGYAGFAAGMIVAAGHIKNKYGYHELSETVGKHPVAATLKQAVPTFAKMAPHHWPTWPAFWRFSGTFLIVGALSQIPIALVAGEHPSDSVAAATSRRALGTAVPIEPYAYMGIKPGIQYGAFTVLDALGTAFTMWAADAYHSPYNGMPLAIEEGLFELHSAHSPGALARVAREKPFTNADLVGPGSLSALTWVEVTKNLAKHPGPDGVFFDRILGAARLSLESDDLMQRRVGLALAVTATHVGRTQQYPQFTKDRQPFSDDQLQTLFERIDSGDYDFWREARHLEQELSGVFR